VISVTLSVNGRSISASIEPRLQLGDLLREHLRLTGTHLACEHGVCGACTVVMNGEPIRSCITLAATCDGADVRTIEGFDEDPTMAHLREAFSREHGLQCGFCTPGMLIAARDIVLRLPTADERRIRDELAGNLCRCTGYRGIVRAVHSVLEASSAGHSAAPPASLVEPPAMARFTPQDAAPPATPTASRNESLNAKGWTTFADEFVIKAPPDTTWVMLSNFTTIAACLPGAQLMHADAKAARGSLAVKLGPIGATFMGSVSIERDEAARIGRAKGAGSDSASRSRTRGELTYRVTPDGDAGSRVFIDVKYNLEGLLAQFSRSGIAREFGRRLVGELAENLNRHLVHGDSRSFAGAPTALPAGRLLWAAFRDWAKRLILSRRA
jgi:carbon-monoxide dehydrogenase small subunit